MSDSVEPVRHLSEKERPEARTGRTGLDRTRFRMGRDHMDDFLYLFRGGEGRSLSPEEIQKNMQKWGAWIQELSEAGVFKGWAATRRRRQGRRRPKETGHRRPVCGIEGGR